MTYKVALVWTRRADTKVLLLFGSQDLELSPDGSQVESGDLLIQYLGEHIDTDFELASSLSKLNILLGEGLVLSLVEKDLSKDLVGERAAH